MANLFSSQQLLCNSSTLMRRASNLELCERFLCGLSLVKVGDRRIVGWADAAGLTNCFHTETISMGKFHKPLSCPPSRPIFDAHFAVQLVPAQWEPSRHTSAPIFTYICPLSTVHSVQVFILIALKRAIYLNIFFSTTENTSLIFGH